MKAIICRSYGAPDDVLQPVDVDKPEMAEDELLVQVHAALVNPAGTVRAVGTNVTSLQPDDEVFGTSFTRGFGAFTELASIPESLVVTKPANLTFDQAAAVPLAASTALQALPRHVEEGHTRGKVVVTVTAPRATQEPTLRASAADDATHRS